MILASMWGLCARHGFEQEHLDVEIAALEPYKGLDFVQMEGRVLTMNPKARMMVRIVASVFDAYIPNADTPVPQRHSKAI